MQMPGRTVDRMTDTRKKLLWQIQVYSFAVNEAVLYLDTHTNDRAALAYYDKYRNLLREAVQMYEKNYGPLTMYGVESADSWTWVMDPWPWEYDAQ